MTVEIHTVQIQLASEHLVLIGFALWVVLPKLQHLLRKKK